MHSNTTTPLAHAHRFLRPFRLLRRLRPSRRSPIGCGLAAAILLSALQLFSPSALSLSASPANMMSKVQRIGDRPGSQMLSIFNACPESPDGKWICYAYYPTLSTAKGGNSPVPVQVIIRDRATGKERVLADAKSGNHNGLNAIWLDPRTIAFQTNANKQFSVMDVITGKKIADNMIGELPHKAVGETLLYFARDAVKSPGKPDDWGIWELNWKTGALRRVVSQQQLYAALHALNPKVLDEKVTLLHVDPSPDGKRVATAYRYQVDGDKAPLLAYFNAADGTGIGFLKDRPMHPLWYDNDTFMGVYTQNKDRLISRYNMIPGERIEKLAGLTTHDSASPDRKWFAGETSYYRPAPDGYTRIALYRRGEMTPAAILAEWKENDHTPTWKLHAHVSCSFSDDGQRVYFLRVTPDNRTEACVFEMSNLRAK